MVDEPAPVARAAELLAPAVSPAYDAGLVQGYLAITLDAAGHVRVRGSRAMLAWALETLAARGWRLDLEEISWCG